MKRDKIAVGYDISIRTEKYSDYSHLHVELIIGRICDAAKQWDEYPCDSNLEFLQKIRKAGSSTKYLSESYDRRITLKWQADREAWDNPNSSRWYGMRVESAPLAVPAMQYLAKLAKLCDEARSYDDPTNVIACIRKLGGFRVTHKDCPYSTWALVGDAEAADMEAAEIGNRPWGVLPVAEVAEVASV